MSTAGQRLYRVVEFLVGLGEDELAKELDVELEKRILEAGPPASPADREELRSLETEVAILFNHGCKLAWTAWLRMVRREVSMERDLMTLLADSILRIAVPEFPWDKRLFRRPLIDDIDDATVLAVHKAADFCLSEEFSSSTWDTMARCWH